MSVAPAGQVPHRIQVPVSESSHHAPGDEGRAAEDHGDGDGAEQRLDLAHGCHYTGASDGFLNTGSASAFGSSVSDRYVAGTDPGAG